MLRTTADTVDAIHETLFAGPRSGVIAVAGSGLEFLASHAQHVNQVAEILAPYVRLIGMSGVCIVVLWNFGRFIFWARRRMLEFFVADNTHDDRPEPCRKCGYLTGYQVKKVVCRDEDDTDEDSRPTKFNVPR